MPTKNPKEDVIVVHLPTRSIDGTTAGLHGTLVITFQRKSTEGFRSVDLKRSRAKLLTLSIIGTIKYGVTGPQSSGQCVDEVRKVWGDDPLVAELCDIWDQWHLNDLRSGTRAQMAVIKNLGRCPVKADWFTWASLNLKVNDLLVDRGYSFGREWLFEKIPATVVERIRTLAKEIDPCL